MPILVNSYLKIHSHTCECASAYSQIVHAVILNWVSDIMLYVTQI